MTLLERNLPSASVAIIITQEIQLLHRGHEDLSADGDAGLSTIRGQGVNSGGVDRSTGFILVLKVLGSSLSVEEAALLDGASGLHRAVRDNMMSVEEALGTRAAEAVADGGREVRDVLWDGVLAAYGASVDT